MTLYADEDREGINGAVWVACWFSLSLAVHLTRDLLDVDPGCFLFVDPYSAASIAGQ